MEEKFKKISEILGSKVTIEENPKTAKKKDEEFFMSLLEPLCQIEAASAMLQSSICHASAESHICHAISRQHATR